MDSNDSVQADAESVAAFFSGGVCAPGSSGDGPLLGGGAWDGLCSACNGDCSPEGPFADYDGTLRCIMEGAGGAPASTALAAAASDVSRLRTGTEIRHGRCSVRLLGHSAPLPAPHRAACPAGTHPPSRAAGDVAFTKHTIPLEVASDGSRPQPWSKMSKVESACLLPPLVWPTCQAAQGPMQLPRGPPPLARCPASCPAGTLHCAVSLVCRLLHPGAPAPRCSAHPGRPCSPAPQADLRLLCPTGGCQPLDQYEACNLAKSPARAVMVRADVKSSAVGQAVQQALVAGGAAGSGHGGWGGGGCPGSGQRAAPGLGRVPHALGHPGQAAAVELAAGSKLVPTPACLPPSLPLLQARPWSRR